ncbi:unnamed protein product, partial [Didymodactylos carnosus]
LQFKNNNRSQPGTNYMTTSTNGPIVMTQNHAWITAQPSTQQQ